MNCGIKNNKYNRTIKEYNSRWDKPLVHPVIKEKDLEIKKIYEKIKQKS